MKRLQETFLTVLATLAIVCVAAHPTADRSWTAVGDDGYEGIASGYCLIVATDSLLIVQADMGIAGWDTTLMGLMVFGPDVLPTPDVSGMQQSFLITGLMPGTYFGSIKAFDDVGNYGALGNIVRFEIEDTVAPAAILTLE